MVRAWLLLGVWGLGLPAATTSVEAAVLTDVSALDASLQLDMRYATSDNFAHTKLYPVARCLLRAEVAHRLVQAQRFLQHRAPGYALLLKDCYRPRSVQVRLWNVVRGTRQQSYVADPNSPRGGSVHSFAAAVDLTVTNAQGHELDMGTPFDYLGRLAEPRREADFAASGQLSVEQLRNRRLLRAAMVEGGGFRAIPNEWWHFDAWQGAALRARYQALDVPLESADVGRPP